MATQDLIRVLVVADDDVAREHLGGVLKRAGFDVDDVPGALAPAQAWIRDAYDVVVVDVRVPVLHHSQLAGLLRAQTHSRGLAVVLVCESPGAALDHWLAHVAPRDVIEKADARRKLSTIVLRAARQHAADILSA